MAPTARPRGESELSQFGAEKFTTRSREVIEAAQLAATTAGNTQTEPIHLLVALLRQEDGTARNLVGKAGVDAARLTAQAEQAMQSLPRASGSTVQQPAAQRLAHPGAGQRARPRRGMKDDYVATEHLLIAAATVESTGEEAAHRRRSHRVGAARGPHRRPRQPARHEPGGRVVVRVAREVLRRPDPGRRGGSSRPGHRAGRRDPPGDPGPQPAYQEQPRAHR